MKRAILKSKTGFTIVELMVAALIMLPIFAGVMIVFMRSMELNELAQNSSTALWQARTRMAEVEGTDFATIFATYNNTTFTAPGLTGIGVTYVDSTNPDLLEVTVSFSWQEKNGRVVGEDSNLDGTLTGGEDANSNGILDSPVMLRTFIYDS